MPAIYAHDYFGLSVVATLPPSFSNLYEKYPEAFRLGFQGPDILFYYKPLSSNPIKKWGMDLHVKTNGEAFFLEMGKRLLQTTESENPSQEEIFEKGGAFAAYIAGFLCHFSLDVSTHPTIDFYSKDGLSHGRIESELDKHVRRQNNAPLRGYNVAKDCIKQGNGCEQAIATALDVSDKQVLKAIRTIRFINGLFVKKSEAFHKFAHGLLALGKMNKGKFGDMFMHQEDEPQCEKLNKKLFEQLTRAIAPTAKRIEYYFANLPQIVQSKQLKEEIFRCNYSGKKYTVSEENT